MKFIKALKDRDLRNRVLLSILLLMLFRILCHIPVPWTDTEVLKALSEDSLFEFSNMFSGGALQNYTIMATGISSYISASIIMQIITFASKKMHEMSREAGGQKTIKKITIMLGIMAAVISSLVTTTAFEKTYGLLTNNAWYVYAVIALLHATGTGIAVFIGETVTEKGFGNGSSLLIFINIVSSFPSKAEEIRHEILSLETTHETVLSCILVMLAVIVLVTLSETSEHRVPMLYSQSAMRSTSLSRERSYFPIRMNLSGVMPVIFAGYLIQILTVLSALIKNESATKVMESFFQSGTVPNAIFMTVTITGFCYLYNFISFDTREIARNLQMRSGSIPGIRPGNETRVYLGKIRSDLSFIGAVYLSLITILPMMAFSYLGMPMIASTSIIIMVGVSLETVKLIKVETRLRTHKMF